MSLKESDTNNPKTPRTPADGIYSEIFNFTNTQEKKFHEIEEYLVERLSCKQEEPIDYWQKNNNLKNTISYG